MNVTITIGSDDDERAVSLTIEDDAAFTPDVFDMACVRAVTHAVWAWRELHPTTEAAP